MSTYSWCIAYVFLVSWLIVQHGKDLYFQGSILIYQQPIAINLKAVPQRQEQILLIKKLFKNCLIYIFA